MMPSPDYLSSKRQNWQTPPEVVDLIRQFNDGNPIDLDPCGSPDNPTRATIYWHPPTNDGLVEEWPTGLAYVNPPFKHIASWVAKIVTHVVERGNDAEVILMATPRTDTAWFRQVWLCSAIAFWHGHQDVKGALGRSRMAFIDPDTHTPTNQNTGPSILAYWGPRAMRFGRTFQPYARIIFP